MSLGLKDVSREKFIESNLGLVHSCANRFRGKGIEYEEMYAAGCIGLVKAYDAFDHDRGVQFSTYAVPMIVGEIKRYLRDNNSVRIARSIKNTFVTKNNINNIFANSEGWKRIPAISNQRWEPFVSSPATITTKSNPTINR